MYIYFKIKVKNRIDIIVFDEIACFYNQNNLFNNLNTYLLEPELSNIIDSS